jgi:Septum formation
MAAPAGVSSGSAQEPVVPKAATMESPAPESAAPEPSGPASGENAAAVVVPEPSEPGPGENVAASAVPEPSESAYGGNAPASADPEPEPPADKRSRKGRGVSWRVTATVVLVVIAVAAAAGALVVTTHGFRPKVIVKYRPAAVYRLRVGECINSSSNGLSVTILSCATPHGAEVFATFSLAGSAWPGSAAVQQQASSGCTNRIAGYLNPQLLNAGLTEEYVYPNQDAWQAGVRTVVCEVSSTTGPLSGSVRSGG